MINALVKRPCFAALAEWKCFDDDLAPICICNADTTFHGHREEPPPRGEPPDYLGDVHTYGALQASYLGKLMAEEVHYGLDSGAFEDDYWDEALQQLFEIECGVSTVRQLEGCRSSFPLQTKNPSPHDDLLAGDGAGAVDVEDVLRITSHFLGINDDVQPYWDRATLDQDSQAAVFLSEYFGSTTSLRLVVYGHFGRDYGERTVALPLGDLWEWQRFAKSAWSDLAPIDRMDAVHLQPQTVWNNGVFTLRVLVSTDFASGWSVCAVECVLDDNEVVFIRRTAVPVTGYSLMRDIDVPFWGNAIFKKFGVIVRGSEPLHLLNGEVLRALVETDDEVTSLFQDLTDWSGNVLGSGSLDSDDPDWNDASSVSGTSVPVSYPHVSDLWCGDVRAPYDPDTDVGSFMQVSTSSRGSYENVHIHHLGVEHSVVHHDGVRSLHEAVQEAWYLPSYGPQSIVELHGIPFPPENFPGGNYIVELNGDVVDKASPLDVLCLTQVFINQQGVPSDRESLFKVHWFPHVASRERALHFFRAIDKCSEDGVRCDIYVNHVLWPVHDSIVKHFRNGDFIQLLIRTKSGFTASSVRCDLRQTEQVERQRRIYNSTSPSGSELGPSPSGGKESKSRSRSPPRGEFEEEEDPEHDEEAMLQTRSPSILNLGSRLPSEDGFQWQKKLRSKQGLHDPPDVLALRKHLCDLRQWPPCSFCNDWTMIPEAHPFVQLVHQLQPVVSSTSAFHIFVDGSYFRKTSQCAWAFVVVLQQPGLEFRRWGYTGDVIRDNPSSMMAEATGASAALHWICSTLADSQQPVTLYCDSTCIGLGIAGDQKLPEAAGIDALKLRAFFQLAKALIPTLQCKHVKAHSGQIDNETADSVAKALATQDWSPFHDLPKFSTYCLVSLWDWAWLMVESEVRDNPEFPDLASLVCKTAFGPALTIGGDVFDHSPEVRRNHPVCEISFAFATANVRALKEQCNSLQSRAGLLAEQFRRENLEVVGLQETRARSSTVTTTNGFVRLISAGAQGHGGVELWFNQHGVFAESSFGPVTPAHCRVWHSSSTVLGVECDHPLMDCDFVVIYAPQAARAQEDIIAWWSELRRLLGTRKGRDLVLLGDYNAKLGSVTSQCVGDWHWDCEDTAGEFARALLVDFDLLLPATFERWHKGQSCTFRSHRGSGTRVDYVAVSYSWQNGVLESSVSSIDLLSGDFDHSAVVLQLSLTVQPASEVVQAHRANYDRAAARDAPHLLANIVASAPVCDVNLDVDAHWRTIEQHCKRQLQQKFPKGRRVQRQYYFSVETWSILESRKDLQKHLRGLDRQEDLLTLGTVFAAWRDGGRESSESAFQTAAIIRQEKAVAIWARSILVGRFRSSKKKDLLQYRASAAINFVDAVNGGTSREIYQALRPKRSVNRSKGFRVPKPLPELDGYDGGRYRGRLVKVWQNHFSNIETADLQLPHDYVDASQPLIQPGMLNDFSLTSIPTRAEVEGALRALSWRKAPGYDGIGAEVWQGDPGSAGLKLYALFLKAVARGYLPLQFRDGFLVPLYKNKGKVSEPTSYRAILLQNAAA